METEKGPMVARSWGEGGMHGGARRSTEHFQVSENTLCDTVMVDTHVIAHLLRPIKCTSPRVNPNVNRGLRVMCMVNLGPWVVINVPSGGGVGSGGSWVSMDARVCMEAEVSMEAGVCTEARVPMEVECLWKRGRMGNLCTLPLISL